MVRRKLCVKIDYRLPATVRDRAAEKLAEDFHSTKLPPVKTSQKYFTEKKAKQRHITLFWETSFF